MCSHCEKKFTSSTDLKGHICTRTEERRNVCPHCKKAFTRPRTLKDHILIHTGEKPHACPHCDMKFAWAKSLKSHMFSHTGEKPHACPHCDKCFTRSGTLKQHILIHTGEKPHAYPHSSLTHCGRRYRKVVQLEAHVEIPMIDKLKNETASPSMSARSKISFMDSEQEPQVCNSTNDAVPNFIKKEECESHLIGSLKSAKLNHQLDFCNCKSEPSSSSSSSSSSHDHGDGDDIKKHLEYTPNSTCFFCVRGFVKEADLTRHLNSHN